MTGSDRERELVNLLDEHGYGAIRLPSSGGGTKRELPDILTGRPIVYPFGKHDKIEIDERSDVEGQRFASESWGIELKSGKATTLYVKSEEVEALLEFCRTWGAKPLLGARSTQQSTPTCYYLVEPEEARITENGNYGLPIGELEERAYAVVEDEGVVVL